MRTKLPNRRMSNTLPFTHVNFMGNEIKSFLTFGYDAEGTIKEVFCADPRIGTDIQAMLVDVCILISLNLQSGADIERLAKSMGENRGEGQSIGPPASVVGSVMQAALTMQHSLNETIKGGTKCAI